MSLWRKAILLFMVVLIAVLFVVPKQASAQVAIPRSAVVVQSSTPPKLDCYQELIQLEPLWNPQIADQYWKQCLQPVLSDPSLLLKVGWFILSHWDLLSDLPDMIAEALAALFSLF